MSREIKFRAVFDDKGTPVFVYFDLRGPLPNKRLPKVWEQYTGIKDANGVEVFEGDVVKIYNHELREIVFVGTVIWSLAWAGFQVVNREGKRPHSIRYHGRLTVIGNIHENPELLEESE